MEVKIFRNEIDFLSGRTAYPSEVKNQSYMMVTLNEYGKVFKKTYYSDQNQIIKEIQFFYNQKSGEVQKKIETNHLGFVDNIIFFGMDSTIKSFLLYLTQVDSLVKNEFYYSKTNFSHDGMKSSVQFMELDGYLIGVIEYAYISQGVLSSEIWTDGQQKRIRFWEYIYYPNGLESITEYGRQGQIIDKIEYHEDGTQKVVVIQYPRAGMPISKGVISYTLSEDLEYGVISFLNHSKTPIDSIGIEMKGLMLNKGFHDKYIVLNSGQLAESGDYTIQITGKSKRGNNITPANILVQVDRMDPELTLTVLPTDSVILVKFSANEPLVSGTIVWLPNPSMKFPSSPVRMNLIKRELELDEFFIPMEYTKLSIEGIYDIFFAAVDRAGNTGKSAIVRQVVYDKTKPEISILSPNPHSFLKQIQVEYEVNEDLRKGRVEFEIIQKEERKTETAGVDLEGEYLYAGTHQIDLSYDLELSDSSYYRLKIYGEDLRGNQSDTSLAEMLFYDFSIPIFTLLYPSSNAFINTSQVSFFLSENLESGSFMWIEVNGNKDEKAPHIIPLVPKELKAGHKHKLWLYNNPKLVHGAQYKLSFTGKDLAGNFCDQIAVENLTYDTKPPKFIFNNPLWKSDINSFSPGFEVNEDLKQAWFEIVEENSLPDSVNTYTVQVPDENLSMGEHQQIRFQDDIQLGDGKTYSITLYGYDRAGNYGKSITHGKIRFIKEN